MTALLQFETLQEHAVLTACFLDVDRTQVPARHPMRPRLVAAWQLGMDGRLLCQWTVAEPAIQVPPD